MPNHNIILCSALLFVCGLGIAYGQADKLKIIFKDCHRRSNEFDGCMKNAFNKLQPFFKSGIPELNIAPFDPHHSPYVEQRRSILNDAIAYHLVVTNATEYKWSDSKVTKYITDWENDRIIYSQDFGEKYLNGNYNTKLYAAGNTIHTKGTWNITLIGYSQTTTVTRVNGPGSLLKVRIEIDNIRDVKLKITNTVQGREVPGDAFNFLLNSMWRLAFPFLKPLIHDLISSAFTDIFNESFRYFPIGDFIKD